MSVSAELKFQLCETNDSTTVFVFRDKKMCKEAHAASATLSNDGKVTPSQSISSEYENCVNTYRVTFPRQSVLNNTVVTIVINGEEHVENIWPQIAEYAMRHYSCLSGSKILIFKAE